MPEGARSHRRWTSPTPQNVLYRWRRLTRNAINTTLEMSTAAADLVTISASLSSRIRTRMDTLNEDFGQLSLERTCQTIVRPLDVVAPPPSSVAKLTQEEYDRRSRIRDACDHKFAEGKVMQGSTLAGRSAIVRRACGRSGTFQTCQVCDRRWRWHASQRFWEIYDKDAVEAGLIMRHKLAAPPQVPPSNNSGATAGSRARSQPSSRGSQPSAPSSRLPEPDAPLNPCPQSTSAASTAAAPATRVAATSVVDEDGFRRITRRARFIASISSDNERESPTYTMDWSQHQYPNGQAPTAATFQQQQFSRMMQEAEQHADQAQHHRSTELAEEYQTHLRQLQSQASEQMQSVQRQCEAEVVQQRAYLAYQNEHLQRQHMIITEQEQAQAGDPQVMSRLMETHEQQTQNQAQQRLIQFENQAQLNMEEVYRREQIRFEEQVASQQHAAEMAVQQQQAQSNLEVVQLRGMLQQMMSQVAPQAALPMPQTPGPQLPQATMPTPHGLPAVLSTGTMGTIQAWSTTPLNAERTQHHALPVPPSTGTTPNAIALEDGQPTDQEWVVTPGKHRSEL